jgi:hypothetical protein
MTARAQVEEGEWGDKSHLLTLDGYRVISATEAECLDAARRLNAILERASSGAREE